jgi:ABC-type polysaccharide/polyol phosphate export permease
LDAQPSTRVYSAESQVRNFSTVVSDMLGGLLSARYVSYRLARKDIKEGYSASAFGWGWDLLDPLILSGIFYYLMQTRLISSEGLGMAPSLFVVYGMMLYQTYTESLVLSTELMQRSRNLLTHLRIPPEALIMSVAYRVGFNSLFRITVMLGFSLFAGEFSPMGFLKFVLCFPLIIFWGMAPGILMAPFHAIYNDVGRVVRLIILPLRFLAPVIYAIPAGTVLGKLQIVNPVSPILVNLRSVAVNNTIVDVTMLWVHLLILGVLGTIGWFLSL